MIRPIQKFVNTESFSGILLFVATIIAVIWANSPWGHYYEAIWQYELGVQTGNFELIKPVILWINDGLMAVFFFVIGLEIKRELLIGELDTTRKAIFPLFAALGGMIAPVLFFLVLNDSAETLKGWAIPMATDIAFALAILKLLGKRVPLSLKIFLTAFAIIDDLGAVVVIALFYSGSINWTLLGYASIFLGLLVYLAYQQKYSKFVTFLIGVIVWTLFLKAGLHPTIAGVLLALTIPIRQKIDTHSYVVNLNTIIDQIKIHVDPDRPVLSKKQIEYIDELETWTENVQSPVQHLEHKLHNWVAYLIMPVFALANAGIVFGAEMEIQTSLVRQIVLSLVIGNPIGILLMTFLALKLSLIEFPEGTNFKQIVGISFLAGVGFTMSIFIANLAFVDDRVLLESVKIGILMGSFLSGLIGYLILRFSK